MNKRSMIILLFVQRNVKSIKLLRVNVTINFSHTVKAKYVCYINYIMWLVQSCLCLIRQGFISWMKTIDDISAALLHQSKSN